MTQQPIIPDLFRAPTWADNNQFSELFLEWQVNDGLGVVVSQENASEEPNILFCSFFPDPVAVFLEGYNLRQHGLTLSAARKMLDQIEAAFARRPLEGKTSNTD